MENYSMHDIKRETVSRLDQVKLISTLAGAMIRDLLKPGPRLSDAEYLSQMNEIFESGSHENEASKN